MENPLFKKRRVFITLISCVILGVVWYVDHISWAGLSLIMFYLMPIFIATWFGGGFAGAIISLCAALFWSVDDFVMCHARANPYVPYANTLINFVFFLLITYIVRRFKRILILEEQFANTDYLTKTANSRFFRQVAEIEINKAKRHNRNFSIIYFDLDNFKAINDNFGHSTGDQLLKTVADAVKESIRAIDIIARLGGDEFAVLLPDTDYQGSELVARRIQENIFKISQKRNWSVTASIGIVTCIKPPISSDEMIKWADEVMYRAKGRGKNMIIHEECKH